MEKIRMRFWVIRKKTIGLCVLLALAVPLLVYSVIGTGAAALYMGYTLRMLPIYNVETDEQKVAISFDASWEDGNTGEIIDILKEYDAEATFFLPGFWARKYSGLVQKMNSAGMEIGTRGNTYRHMPKLDDTQLELELSASKAAVAEITEKEAELFRAPYGDYSDRVLTACREAGLTVIQWDVDSMDWKELSSKAMAERVLSRVKSGSIVLFNCDGKYTPGALPAILTGLRNKGYEVTTVGGLLIEGDYYIDHGGTMRKSTG